MEGEIFVDIRHMNMADKLSGSFQACYGRSLQGRQSFARRPARWKPILTYFVRLSNCEPSSSLYGRDDTHAKCYSVFDYQTAVTS